MASPNRPPSRPSSRTPAIPIPGAAPRSIEDILNINTLGSPPATPSRSHDPRPEQRQSRMTARSLYSGIEASRPTSGMRHASTSSSVGASRHSLLGGSGPPWGARTVSASAAPVYLPGNFGMQSAISTFEPRVIGGSGATSSDRSSMSIRQDLHTSTSPSRRLARMSTGGRPVPVPRSGPFSSHRAPSLTSPAVIRHTHHHLGNGAPTAFKRPSYLQYSSLRDFLQTDMDSSSPPRPTLPVVSGRDVTPVTESDEDSESSGSYSRAWPHSRPGRGRARERQSAYYSPVTPANSDSIIHLPTRWNDQDKNKYLHISEDGRNLSFHGPTQQGEKEAAAARANHPIPPACGIYYYEVTILDKGYKGHISVGFSCSGVRLNRLPGWERNSWGYHGDDGNSFASERDGTPFGPKFTTGDVVGCGIDFSLGKAFYTKNSSLLGYAFENIGQGEAIYPSVGLRTPQEQIRVNFGQEPFKYDIEYHVHLARDRAWSRIQATPVKWTIDWSRDIFDIEEDKAARKDSSAEVKQEATDDDFTPISLAKDYSEPIDKLILSYLHHHGYENTASALKAQIDARRKKAAMAGKLAVSKKEEMDVDIKMEADDNLPVQATNGRFELNGLGRDSGSGTDVMRYRQRIVNAVLTGDIDLALQLIQEVCPSVLETDEGFLYLKLKCRKFVELILRASDALQAIKNAEAETTPILAESAGSTGEVDMDVDEDNDQSQTNGFSDGSTPVTKPVPLSPRMKRTSSRSVPPPVVAAYQSALSEALSYGKALHAEMPRAESMSGVGARPEAHALLKTTFSLVTYDDPRVAGGEVQALTSREARAKLAGDVNQAILESQGRPSRPALERMYRQTSVVLDNLARTGVGDAAFADMYSEFLDA